METAMEKINYFSLFLKALVFALIILALKTFFSGIARADEFTTDDLEKFCIQRQQQLKCENPSRKYEDVSEFLECTTNDLAADRHKAAIQRKQHIKESYEAAQNGSIARYVSEHYVEAPISAPGYIPEYTPPVYYAPAYHQTHYSGVIHGPNIGDWYTVEGVSY